MSENCARSRSTTEIHHALLQEQLEMWIELDALIRPLREVILRNYREGIEPGKWAIADLIPDYRPLVVAAPQIENFQDKISEFQFAIAREIKAAIAAKDATRLQEPSTYQEIRDKIMQSHVIEAQRLVKLLDTKVSGAWRAKRDRAYRTKDWSDLPTLFREMLSIQETRLRMFCALAMFRLGFAKQAESMCQDAAQFLSQAIKS